MRAGGGARRRRRGGLHRRSNHPLAPGLLRRTGRVGIAGPALVGGVRSLAPSIPAEVRVIAAGPCAAGEAGRARSGGSKASIAAVEMGCGGGAGLVAATVVGAGGAVAVGCIAAAA